MKDTCYEQCATEDTNRLSGCAGHCHDTQPNQNNGDVFSVVAMSSDRFFKQKTAYEI